ncbi:VOC family protein [Bacillus atrophaeus]|uniref:VOC family protein n=1 Tax=Bacillus atrophaeus TaxID=1452 RepID=UPI0022824025|nr:VOC family protein [Bacillus atrophaeus]MCY9160700.1 VOC family protein [Bacillus atrophaeus]
MTEFYPMPLFVKLSVSDIERSLSWYKAVLHFESVFELTGNDGKKVMAHIRGKKYQDILLESAQMNTDINGKGVKLNVTTDDVDSFFEKAKSVEAKITEGPIDRPWNARELVLQDPDGYLITLSMQIDKNKTMDEITEQINN